MSYKYIAVEESLLKSDEIPVGAVITGRAVIEVSLEGKPYNRYTGLVYEWEGERFAIFLDKAAKVFRSIPCK